MNILRYIDSHFHSTVMHAKGLSVSQALTNAYAAGVRYGLDIAVTSDDFEEREHRISDFPWVYMSAGLYPSQAALSAIEQEQALSCVRTQVCHPRVVALGEIGIDLYHNYASLSAQIELFEKQIYLATEYNIPIIIHNREADIPVLDVLQRCNAQHVILHCFSSDKKMMKTALDRGYYISFSGNVTFKNAYAIQEAARECPLQQMLLETDAPYLAPNPYRGKINQPLYICDIYHYIAQIRACKLETIMDHIMHNFLLLFCKNL